MDDGPKNSGISWLSHPKNLFSDGQSVNKTPSKHINELQKKPSGTQGSTEIKHESQKKRNGKYKKRAKNKKSKLQKNQNQCPNEKIQNECSNEQNQNECPNEKNQHECPNEKSQNECPNEKSQNECSNQKNQNECPNEKNQNECHNEKNQNECHNEKKHKEDELIQKLKSNIELFEMVNKLASIVDDTRNAGTLKRKILNDAITSLEEIEDKSDISVLAEMASDYKELSWKKTVKSLMVSQYHIKTTGSLLDSGSTAHIYSGTFVKNGAKYKVAIKKIKLFNEEVLLREAMVLSQLDHSNIVKLIAVSENKLEIALELMEFGSLSSALKIHAVTELELLNVIKDVATGMEYLHSKNLIHRDLACRNVLVNSHKQCKIGDFGHCVYVGYTDGEYRKEMLDPFLAIRAENISPEICNLGYFSKASDVWAMGIVIYDMFIRSYENSNILIRLMDIIAFRSGQQSLEKPSRCPKNIWKFTLEKMLNRNKMERASFSLIREKIDLMIQEKT